MEIYVYNTLLKIILNNASFIHRNHKLNKFFFDKLSYIVYTFDKIIVELNEHND